MEPRPCPSSPSRAADPSFPSCLASFPPPSRAFPSLGAIFFSPGGDLRRRRLPSWLAPAPARTPLRFHRPLPQEYRRHSGLDRSLILAKATDVVSLARRESSVLLLLLLLLLLPSSTSSVSDQAPVPSPSPLPRSKRLRSGAKRLGEVSVQNELRLPRPIRKKTTRKKEAGREKTSCSCASSSKSSSFCDDGEKTPPSSFFYESRRRQFALVLLISREYYSLLVCERVCSFCIAYLKIFSRVFPKKYRFFWRKKQSHIKP